MGGINLVNEAAAFEYIDGFQGNANEAAVEIMSFAGTEFSEDAKLNANFIDDTVNLRNSIGYVVAIKGRLHKQHFGGEGGNNDWQKETEQGAKTLLKLAKGNVTLIGLAGMSYGVYVENMKGKSVISQSIPKVEKLLNRLFDELT